MDELQRENKIWSAHRLEIFQWTAAAGVLEVHLPLPGLGRYFPDDLVLAANHSR